MASGSTKDEKMDELIQYIKDSKLNSMVIDVKDDAGNITMKFHTGNKLIDKNEMDLAEAKPLLKKLKKTIFIQSHVLLPSKILNWLRNILNGHLKIRMGQFGRMVKAIALLIRL